MVTSLGNAFQHPAAVTHAKLSVEGSVGGTIKVAVDAERSLCLGRKVAEQVDRVVVEQ